jgi:hypothetical protein
VAKEADVHEAQVEVVDDEEEDASNFEEYSHNAAIISPSPEPSPLRKRHL